MNDDSSLARKSAACATSSGSPRRPSGWRETDHARAAAGSSARRNPDSRSGVRTAPGDDRIDADPLRGMIHRHRASEGGDRALGSEVGRVAPAAGKGELGGDEDDGAAAPCAHRADGGAGPEKAPREVRVEHPFPLGEGRIGDALAARPPGAGEEDVEPAEPLVDGRRVTFHRRLVADVALEQQRRLPRAFVSPCPGAWRHRGPRSRGRRPPGRRGARWRGRSPTLHR